MTNPLTEKQKIREKIREVFPLATGGDVDELTAEILALIEKPATQEPENEWDARAEAGEKPFDTPQQEGWRDRFRKKFYRNENRVWMSRGGESYDSITPEMGEGELFRFIRTELAGQRERIAGEIEKMKARETDCQHTPNDSCDSDCAYQQFNRGWNDALLRSASIARATE